jgi:cephalosporin hydroxylase
MALKRHLSTSGVRELLSDARFVVKRDTRVRGREELDRAISAADVLNVVNRYIPGGASQIPEEILAFIHLAGRGEPRTLVEIGTEAGGTHLLFGRAIPSLEQTIAVDLRVRNRRSVQGLRRDGLKVDVIDGDSSSTEVLQRVRGALAGRAIDVLFIDGDHSYRGAMSDVLLYRPLVRSGGLVAFHDIVPDRWLRTGSASSAYAGEVPLVWQRVRDDFVCHEFVASWDQEGKGIGVFENDPDIALRPLFEFSTPS